MARPLRVNIPDGWYHCMHRGLERRTIFSDDGDCRHFVELPGEASTGSVCVFMRIAHALKRYDINYVELSKLTQSTDKLLHLRAKNMTLHIHEGMNSGIFRNFLQLFTCHQFVKLLKRVEGTVAGKDRASYSGEAIRGHDEQESEAMIIKGMKVLNLAEDDLDVLSKGAEKKSILAWLVHTRTMASRKWIGREGLQCSHMAGSIGDRNNGSFN